MRSILGMYRLDRLLTDKQMLIGHMQQTLDAHTNFSGLNVSNVEIQHISLTESTANVVSRQNERARETAGHSEPRLPIRPENAFFSGSLMDTIRTTQ